MITDHLPEPAARQGSTARRRRRIVVGLVAALAATVAVSIPLGLRAADAEAGQLVAANAKRPTAASDLPASKLLGQAGWLPDGYRSGHVSAGTSSKFPFQRVQYDRDGTQPICVIVADSPKRTPLEFVPGSVADLPRSVPIDINGKPGRTTVFEPGGAFTRYTWWQVRSNVWITVYAMYDTAAQREAPQSQRDLLRVVRGMTLVPANRWVSPTGPTRFPFTLHYLPAGFTDRFAIMTRTTRSTLPPAKPPITPAQWGSQLSYLPANVNQDALTPAQEKAATERTPLTVSVSGATEAGAASGSRGPIDRATCFRDVSSTGPATLWSINCVSKRTGLRVSVSSTQLRHAELDRILTGLTLVDNIDSPTNWVADPDGR